jgi:hypothetical protein
LQAGNLADGQRHLPAFHMYVYFWPQEIEGWSIGVQSG